MHFDYLIKKLALLINSTLNGDSKKLKFCLWTDIESVLNEGGDSKLLLFFPEILSKTMIMAVR
jgi:hypothetical protein